MGQNLTTPRAKPHTHPCMVHPPAAGETIAHHSCRKVEGIILECRRALDESCPGDYRARVACLSALGSAMEARYLHTWHLDDLEERIACWRSALEVSTQPNTDVDAKSACSTCGSVSSSRSARDDAQDSVALILVEICDALHDRYLHSYQASDLDEQNFLARAALGRLITPASLQNRAFLCLGTALRTRYELFCDLGDLDNAVELHQQATDCTPHGWPDRYMYLTELGITLKRVFDRTGQQDLFSKVLDCQKQALELAPASPHATASASHNLAVSLGLRGKMTNSQDDLREARKLLDRALLLRPEGHRDRHMTLFFLGNVIWVMGELDVAIGVYRKALELRPIGHPERATILNMLAVMHHERFDKSLDPSDVRSAIDFAQQALGLCPPYKTLLARRDSMLVNLGTVLQEHFASYGDVHSLDKAIVAYRHALDLYALGDPWRYVAVYNLAHALRQRYSFSQEMEDISEAIFIQEEALVGCSPGQSAFEGLVYGLAAGYTARYELTGLAYNTNAVIELLRSALSRAREDARFTLAVMAELATTHKIRFVMAKDLSSLDESIRLSRAVISSPLSVGKIRRDCLALLGTCLRLRFECLHDIQVAEEAVTVLQQACELFPDEHQARSFCYAELARLHLAEGVPSFDIAKSIALLTKSLKLQSREAQLRLMDALDVLEMFEHTTMRNASSTLLLDLLSVHRLAMALLPRVAYFGLGQLSQLKALKRGDSFAIMAAMTALSLGQPHVALELLEEGRAVFWQQYLRLRTPFDDLPHDLAARLLETSKLLERRGNDVKDKLLLEAEAVRKRELGEQFEGLLAEARCLPGLDRFLRHDSFEAIRSAAAHGPVLVLVSGKTQSYAIILPSQNRDAMSIRLTEVDAEVLQKLAVTVKVDNVNRKARMAGRAIRQSYAPGRQRLADVMQVLWMKVMQPVIEALKLARADGRKRQRLIICATGAFTNLPLHAALNQSGRGVVHYAVPTYTPTIGALLNARRTYRPLLRSHARVLLAVAPFPPGRTPLYATAEEVEVVRSLVAEQCLLPVPPVQKALDDVSLVIEITAQEAMENLQQASILHCACHGLQDTNNPLDGGFVLRDRTLTMSELMELKLPHAFLAVLSACDTAKGDNDQPDQAAHLASALLFAGFKSIVGTMWSMGDADGPVITKKVYGELFAGESKYLDSDVVPYALDAAVTELRAKGIHPCRWVPYVHLGI